MMFEKDLNLEATELRLGLPGSCPDEQTCSSNIKSSNKRSLPSDHDHINNEDHNQSQLSISENISSLPRKYSQENNPSPTKAQVVGWPPVRSYRKNSFQAAKKKEAESGMFIKVSMDGAPFLRKIDLKIYQGYLQLLQALENMFKFSIGKYCDREGYNGSEYVPTYEDKDGDWMLVGDVPWEMFISSCKKLRIMKGSEARGLGSCGEISFNH